MTHITTLSNLRALYGPVGGRSAKKSLSQLDTHSSRIIGLSPFVLMASGQACKPETQQDRTELGDMDASPRGGAPGFVKVVNPHTLLIPDSPGNNRLDTLENIVSHGEGGAPVGLVFLIPGMDETLRVNGLALLSTSEAERRLCAEPDRVPKLVIRVQVQACYVHCAKALMRAQLWDPSKHVDRATLPSMGEIMRDQLREFHGVEVAAESQAEMVERYQQTL